MPTSRDNFDAFCSLLAGFADAAGAYKNVVLDYFREEYLAGRTPNPSVRCNQRM